MVAFALGAMPGTDMVAAADVIAGETGDVRAIPRLPARGIMSDAVVPHARYCRMRRWLSAPEVGGLRLGRSS